MLFKLLRQYTRPYRWLIAAVVLLELISNLAFRSRADDRTSAGECGRSNDQMRPSAVSTKTTRAIAICPNGTGYSQC